MSQSTTIAVRIIPRASRNEIKIGSDGTLKIRIQAPPVEGKANKALVKFLSKILDIPQRNIIIVSGESSRDKRLEIQGVTKQQLSTLLTGKN